MMANLSIGEDMGIETTRDLFDEQMQLSLEETFGGVDGWQWGLIEAYHSDKVYAYLRSCRDSSCTALEVQHGQELAVLADALVEPYGFGGHGLVFQPGFC